MQKEASCDWYDKLVILTLWLSRDEGDGGLSEQKSREEKHCSNGLLLPFTQGNKKLNIFLFFRWSASFHVSQSAGTSHQIWHIEVTSLLLHFTFSKATFSKYRRFKVCKTSTSRMQLPNIMWHYRFETFPKRQCSPRLDYKASTKGIRSQQIPLNSTRITFVSHSALQRN